MKLNVFMCDTAVVVRVDDKPIRLQLCDTAGQVGLSRLYDYAAAATLHSLLFKQIVHYHR